MIERWYAGEMLNGAIITTFKISPWYPFYGLDFNQATEYI